MLVLSYVLKCQGYLSVLIKTIDYNTSCFDKQNFDKNTQTCDNLPCLIRKLYNLYNTYFVVHLYGLKFFLRGHKIYGMSINKLGKFA